MLFVELSTKLVSCCLWLSTKLVSCGKKRLVKIRVSDELSAALEKCERCVLRGGQRISRTCKDDARKHPNPEQVPSGMKRMVERPLPAPQDAPQDAPAPTWAADLKLPVNNYNYTVEYRYSWLHTTRRVSVRQFELLVEFADPTRLVHTRLRANRCPPANRCWRCVQRPKLLNIGKEMYLMLETNKKKFQRQIQQDVNHAQLSIPVGDMAASHRGAACGGSQ
ncbi:uncharacterized protein [Maniola hyperantus]|uniref:uncharacterized protein n=1 Tax=Aphantopus hyperantus TaxID=2795564 RepID=UPI003748456B